MDRQGNIDVIGSRLDSHVESCEGFRKLVLAAIVGAATSVFGVVGVVYNNQNNAEEKFASETSDLSARISEVRARQDVVLTRLAVIDQTIDSVRKDMTDRFGNVVAANAQRENTFGQRFEQIGKELNELMREFYVHRLQEKGQDEYVPSSGPQRRR